MVTVTEAARERLARLLAVNGKEEGYLRLYVAPGGCSGYSYGLALEETPGNGDVVVEEGGLRLLIDDFSAPFVAGAEIDYVDNLMGGGFAIKNPNAAGTCGCGQSFRPKEGDGGSPAPCC